MKIIILSMVLLLILGCGSYHRTSNATTYAECQVACANDCKFCVRYTTSFESRENTQIINGNITINENNIICECACIECFD